ncbi:MAG: acyltransferase [Chloroflexi bacterium]|nr:acyltransferase [Chloroflexota bacterium]
MNIEQDGGATGGGRLLGLDILRGVAIMWVVLYHMWADFKVLPHPPRYYYGQIWDRVQAGQPSALTAVWDLVMRMSDGSAVPFFMTLSGVALGISACRAGSVPDPLGYAWRRIAKIMPPYWFAFGYAMLVISGVALVQAWLHGGGFVYQLQHGVTFGRYVRVPIDVGFVFAGLTMVPRALREEWLYAPLAVLWFVPLLIQYYLLFPWLFRFMKRYGPVALLGISLVVGITVQLAIIRIWNGYTVPQQYGIVFSGARIYEFTLGMAVAYAIVHRRAALDRFVRTPTRILPAVAAGLVLQSLGTRLDMTDHYLFAFSSSMIITGVMVVFLPVLLWRPTRVPVPAAILATAGAASYGVLIVNEPFRYVLSLMRNELPGFVTWPVIIVLYVPMSIILAQPLSRFLGLLPANPAATPRIGRTAEDDAHAPGAATTA